MFAAPRLARASRGKRALRLPWSTIIAWFRSTTAPDRGPRVKTWRVASPGCDSVVLVHGADGHNEEEPELDPDCGAFSEERGGHLRQSATPSLPPWLLVPRGGADLTAAWLR
jgi:hypothetical protein